MPYADPGGVGVKPAGCRGYLAIACFMGFAAAITQVVLVRELMTNCRGNELVIGILFASWFMGIYLGARVNPPGMPASLERRVLASMLLLPLLLAGSVYGASAVQLVFPRALGTFYSFGTELALSALFTFPVSFFVGFFFPPLVVLVSEEMKEHAGGAVFYIESLGSFAGGLVFSFVLVEIANPLAIAAAFLSFAAAAVCLLRARRLLPLALVILALPFFSGRIEERIFSCVWDRTHAGKLELSLRTKYQTLSVESSDGTVSVYGDGMLMYTLPDRYESRGLFHLVNAFRGDGKRVLLLGSGPGALLHNLLGTGIERISYCEPDPQLWDALAPYREKLYPAADYSRLRVLREDVRHFLSGSAERFDLIVSIPPAPENLMLNRFYTREYFVLCKKHLSARGVFITSLRGFSNYLSADLRDSIASIYHAFKGEFPAGMAASGETMYLVGAAPGILPADADTLIRRYAGRLPVEGGPFEPELVERYSADELRAFFEKSQLGYFNDAMRSRDRPVKENRDLRPGTYWKNIILAAFREQSALYRLLRGGFVIPGIILLLSVVAAWDVRRRYGRRQLLSGIVIYLTGMISISAMLVMILVYQNAHGIVYYRISLINALFMLGLALGAYAASRSKPGLPAVITGLSVSLGLVLANTFIGSDTLFWVLLVAVAALCGAVFPLLFTRTDENESLATASVLDSMDHFGAIAGSLLTVTLFLPLLGIRGTLSLAIVLAVPAALAAGAGKWKK